MSQENAKLIDICLNCILPNCDESDPRCPLENRNRLAWKIHNRKRRENPEYRKLELESKKRWRKTLAGKASMCRSQKKYRKSHPKIMAAINRKYYTKNREKILMAKKVCYKLRGKLKSNKQLQPTAK